MPTRPPGREGLCFTGKITGLIFDRFGDFEGFLLQTEQGPHQFRSRERDVKDLVETAWRERLRLTVCTEPADPHHPASIILCEPPTPFSTCE